MFDLLGILLLISWTIITCLLVYTVFKIGYEKEKRGERTDFMGRPNNHLGKDMD